MEYEIWHLVYILLSYIFHFTALPILTCCHPKPQPEECYEKKFLCSPYTQRHQYFRYFFRNIKKSFIFSY